MIYAAFQEGWQQQQARIDALTARIVELTAASAPKPARRMTDGGAQIVEVDHRLAYRWEGPEPLAVGDVVMLPGNYVSALKHGPGPYLGTVTALGTDYDGALSAVLRRAGP